MTKWKYLILIALIFFPVLSSAEEIRDENVSISNVEAIAIAETGLLAFSYWASESPNSAGKGGIVLGLLAIANGGPPEGVPGGVSLSLMQAVFLHDVMLDEKNHTKSEIFKQNFIGLNLAGLLEPGRLHYD